MVITVKIELDQTGFGCPLYTLDKPFTLLLGTDCIIWINVMHMPIDTSSNCARSTLLKVGAELTQIWTSILFRSEQAGGSGVFQEVRLREFCKQEVVRL